MASGKADAQGEWCAHLGRPVLQFECEGDARLLVDRDDHAAVTEPLRDAHAALAGDLPGDGAKGAEDATGGIVAEGGGVVGESRQVDEGERPGHAHGARIPAHVGGMRCDTSPVARPRAADGD